MELFDFNNEPTIGMDILTTYNGKTLILKNIYKYEGPITMQYLPYGGIQSVFDYQLIINTKIGFIASRELIYDDDYYNSKDFIIKNSDLVNKILPD